MGTRRNHALDAGRSHSRNGQRPPAPSATLEFASISTAISENFAGPRKFPPPLESPSANHRNLSGLCGPFGCGGEPRCVHSRFGTDLELNRPGFAQPWRRDGGGMPGEAVDGGCFRPYVDVRGFVNGIRMLDCSYDREGSRHTEYRRAPR